MVAKLSIPAACPFCTVPCSRSWYARYPGSKPRNVLAFPRQRLFATTVHGSDFMKNNGQDDAKSTSTSTGHDGHDGHDHDHDDHDPRHHNHSRVARHGHVLPWPKTANPTPYEIFNQAKSAPYQKARYYELVKQYHPDRHRHVQEHMHGLSAATMTERYRMVVVANSILSNPQKRRQYDLYGAGWAGRSEINSQYRHEQRWQYRPGTAANNATWEDWEKWHQAQSGNKQEPQFMSNGSFAVVILIFIFLGGWAQFTRGSSGSMRMMDGMDSRHQAIGHGMYQRRLRSAALNREERVDDFLDRREGWGYAMPPTPQSVTERRRSGDDDE